MGGEADAARLGRGESFLLLPHNLVVLMRTLFILESALRDLDPEFRSLDTLLARGAEALQSMAAGAAGAAALARLKQETALTMQGLPVILGAWLHRTQREVLGCRSRSGSRASNTRSCASSAPATG